MKVHIPPKPADDPRFVEIVCRVISGLLNANAVEEVSVVQIDNWFDQKWLRCSGSRRMRFSSFELDADTDLDEFQQDTLIFPQFTPNRVIEKYYFRRESDGSYAPSDVAPSSHSRRLASSYRKVRKIRQPVVKFSHSAIFVWYSSNSGVNSRGSLLVYQTDGTAIAAWYADFAKAEEWKIFRLSGLDWARLQRWLEHDDT